MNLSGIKILKASEIKMVDRGSKEILHKVGVRIKSREVLALLANRGVRIDLDRQTARFEPDLVQEAIEETPGEFEIYDRDRCRSLKVGVGSMPRIAAGHNAIYLYDMHKNERRPMSKHEVGLFAKLAHYLEEIDIVAPEAMPNGTPGKSSILHAVDAVVNNTSKPILFSCEDEVELSGILDIIRTVSDGRDQASHPYAIAQFSPSSPLYWNQGTVKGFVKVVQEGLPCTVLPGVIAGATGPYTLAGTLVQKNAEALSGVVIAQLIRKGAPILIINGAAKFDMRTQNAVFGSAEGSLLEIAGSQMLNYYGIPSHACVPTSDSHCLDQQMGIENMKSIFTNIACGTSLIVNAGMFAGGQTAAFEQLVIDNEIVKVSRRLMRGLAITDEKLALESILRVGPMGNYLVEPSTIENLRSGEWIESDIFVRESYDIWREQGGRMMAERASDLVEQLRNRDDISLEPGRQKRIQNIIDRFENRYQ